MSRGTCALVLGARVVDGGPSPALRRRAEHAARLWLAGDAQVVVCTGADRWGGPSEAAVIAGVCRAMGVPEAALVLEERATDTVENLRFSKGLVAGFDRVLVVTDRAHGRRARMIARRLGMVVEVSAPPSPPWSRARVRRVLREGVALVWYWARG